MNAIHSWHARTLVDLGTELTVALRAGPSLLRAYSAGSVRISDDSVPEPDVSIAEYHDDGILPLAKLKLAIEIADSTAAIDLGVKLRLYAQAGVPEYWVRRARYEDHSPALVALGGQLRRAARARLRGIGNGGYAGWHRRRYRSSRAIYKGSAALQLCKIIDRRLITAAGQFPNYLQAFARRWLERAAFDMQQRSPVIPLGQSWHDRPGRNREHAAGLAVEPGEYIKMTPPALAAASVYNSSARRTSRFTPSPVSKRLPSSSTIALSPCFAQHMTSSVSSR